MRNHRLALIALTAIATLVPAGTASAAGILEYGLLVGFIG